MVTVDMGMRVSWIRYLVYLSVVLVGTLHILAGCSSDNPVEPSGAMVSDFGVLVRTLEYSDGTIPVYEHEGVTYLGDMLLGEVSDALAVVSPNFAEFEVLVRVFNYRVYPESQLDSSRPSDVFSLWTCTSDTTRACDTGNVYKMKESGGRLEVYSFGNWHI